MYQRFRSRGKVIFVKTMGNQRFSEYLTLDTGDARWRNDIRDKNNVPQPV
jgi:hypothetical protein